MTSDKILTCTAMNIHVNMTVVSTVLDVAAFFLHVLVRHCTKSYFADFSTSHEAPLYIKVAEI